MKRKSIIKKKTTKENISQIYQNTHSVTIHVHHKFVSYGRPDERGRLSKHPNTEIFVGGRDVDEEIL